jgi:hypothetical protein
MSQDHLQIVKSWSRSEDILLDYDALRCAEGENTSGAEAD